MGDLSLKIGWQVDDMNGTEWALLWTDTTTDTESLRDVGNFRFGSDFDTEFAGPDNRT